MGIVLKTDIEGIRLVGRGKVRDIYEIKGYYLIVTTDRISAFDVILPNGIPNKGYVLTQLSKFWFEKTAAIVDNHLITTDIGEMPDICKKYRDILEGRSMLVKKAESLPVECVVRGYLAGSGWKDYQKTGCICDVKLEKGLVRSQKLSTPIFTPATKAELGKHDENIGFDHVKNMTGKETASKIYKYSMDIYNMASNLAEKKNIIIADTKMEFGIVNNGIILIDEVLTPDSSRFWYKNSYKPGEEQKSMDKQFVRNYLETLDWDKTAPGPTLPADIVNQTSKRYMEIMETIIN